MLPRAGCLLISQGEKELTTSSNHSGKQQYRVILKVQLSKKASLTCLAFPELQTVHQLPNDKCLENQAIIPLPSGECYPIHLLNNWSLMTHFFSNWPQFSKI